VIRLLEVVVQAVLVEDDGVTLTKRVAEPVVVRAADWPGYPVKLAVDIAALTEGDTT
jgi:hypothetical protein